VDLLNLKVAKIKNATSIEVAFL